jgi:hypothetical protein
MFLWLILQHVLPTRFRRARNFGYLHPNSRYTIGLIALALDVNINGSTAWCRPRPGFTCPKCAASMRVVQTRIPPGRVTFPRERRKPEEDPSLM